MMRSFWLGSTSAKIVVCFHGMPEGLVAQIIQFGAGQNHCVAQANRLPGVACDQFVIPRNHLQLNAQFSQRLNGFLNALFGRVEE